MKNTFYRLSCTAALLLGCPSLQAETTEVVLSNSMKCTKEELMRFFPEQVVQEVLLKANLPKQQADAIAKDLASKDKELARIVEERSAKIDTSTKSGSHRDMATKVYRETLYQVFSQVLKENGVTSEDQIQVLLDDLQEARSKLFIECIRKQPKRVEKAESDTD